MKLRIEYRAHNGVGEEPYREVCRYNLFDLLKYGSAVPSHDKQTKPKYVRGEHAAGVGERPRGCTQVDGLQRAAEGGGRRLPRVMKGARTSAGAAVPSSTQLC